MPVQLLETIKQQSSGLTPHEKLLLGSYLLEQAKLDQPVRKALLNGDAAEVKRRQHLEWLKAHREEYAGKYVALDGDTLVGQGETLREAHEQSRQNGVTNPFLVRVISESEVLFGGW